MNSRTLATIACKALAIYGTLISLSYLTLFASSLAKLGNPSSYNNESELVFSIIAETVPFLLQLIFVILLWKNAEHIAQKMVPESAGHDAYQFTSENLYIVGFTIIGIYILIETVPDFVYQIANLWTTRRFDFGREQTIQRYLGLIVPGIKILIALILLLGGKSIMKTISGLREIMNERLEARKLANGA